ncbi:MAG: hypothetical protein AAFX05_12995 [Planctomycetota bacterium]
MRSRFSGGMALAGMLTLCVGCASSPFVGSWEAETVPQGMPSGTVGSLEIAESGSYVVTFEDRRGNAIVGLEGTWEAESDTVVLFEVSEGPEGMERGRGTLGANDRLRVVAGRDAAVFKRAGETGD